MLQLIYYKQNLNLTGLMSLFLKFIGGNCNRPMDGGKDTKGWYPLYGVTTVLLRS